MADLTAGANIRGRAIDLALAWSDPSARARSLRVVRRRWAYPADPQDGLAVVDLADLFTPDGAAPWGRIARTRFLLLNPRAEGGILRAALSLYFTGAGDPQPRQVALAVEDAETDQLDVTVVSSVSRVTTTSGSGPGFGVVTTMNIYGKQPDGTEALAATLLISTQAVDPGPITQVTDYTQPADDDAAAADPDAPRVSTTPAPGLGRLDWTPAAAGATTISVSFVRQELHTIVATVSSAAPLDVSFETDVDGFAIRAVRFTETQSAATGNVERALAISDREPPTRALVGFEPGLEPRLTYYYAVFQETGDGLTATPRSTASALATGGYGFAERLYALLPAIHRYLDDPAGGGQGSWQLRKFLEIFGAGLDQARSLAEALPALHDVFEVGAGYLPLLARSIGWQTDRTLPAQRQRTDLLFAPEIFSTVGTVPNVRAMVGRATGWGCQVKEMINNVFLTNVPAAIPFWEIWEADSPSSVAVPFTATSPVSPARVTSFAGDSIDARPAISEDPDGRAPWLFWQSDRSVGPQSPTRQRLWTMQANGTDTPRPVLADSGALLDDQPAAHVDAIGNSGVIRLFWSSDRGQGRSLYTVTIAGGVLGSIVQLTNLPSADDQFPAVAKDLDGTLWLFWQSSRRGPTDIWAMTLARNATDWSAPARITSGQPRDRMPTAVVGADGHLNLFWTADRGSGSRIFQSIFDGTRWSDAVDFLASLPGADPAPATPTFRDEAPAAVLFSNGLCVFWQSDRDGTSHVYVTEQGGLHGELWSPPFRVTSGNAPEREPTAIRTAGALHLFFRTQRDRPSPSRTVDFSDLGDVRRGQVDDQWRYTYSTAATPASFLSQEPVYARDAVGLYLTPAAGADAADHRSVVSRAQAFVEPFRPVNTRLVWFLPPGDPTI